MSALGSGAAFAQDVGASDDIIIVGQRQSYQEIVSRIDG
jgi:hypothetical protein